jgi:taurine dioxygenase
MHIRELQPGFGAEIIGYEQDHHPEVNPKELVTRFGVIFIRDIELDVNGFEEFAKQFGDMQDISGKPSFTSTTTDSKYVRAMEYDGTPVDFPAGWFWHAEASYLDWRPSGGLLYMTKVPSSGGDTLFADQRTAYNQLSDRMKDYIKDLTCFHEVGWWFKNKPEAGTEQNVVEIHPVTGERYLNVSEIFTTRINGLPHDEAKHLLSFLREHATNDMWTHRHTWTKNCVAIWDDRLIQHKAIHNFFGRNEGRVGYRIHIN